MLGITRVDIGTIVIILLVTQARHSKLIYLLLPYLISTTFGVYMYRVIGSQHDTKLTCFRRILCRVSLTYVVSIMMATSTERRKQ